MTPTLIFSLSLIILLLSNSASARDSALDSGRDLSTEMRAHELIANEPRAKNLDVQTLRDLRDCFREHKTLAMVTAADIKVEDAAATDHKTKQASPQLINALTENDSPELRACAVLVWRKTQSAQLKDHLSQALKSMNMIQEANERLPASVVP